MEEIIKCKFILVSHHVGILFIHPNDKSRAKKWWPEPQGVGMMTYGERLKMYQNSEVLRPVRNQSLEIELRHQCVVLSLTSVCMRKVRVLWVVWYKNRRFFGEERFIIIWTSNASFIINSSSRTSDVSHGEQSFKNVK